MFLTSVNPHSITSCCLESICQLWHEVICARALEKSSSFPRELLSVPSPPHFNNSFSKCITSCFGCNPDESREKKKNVLSGRFIHILFYFSLRNYSLKKINNVLWLRGRDERCRGNSNLSNQTAFSQMLLMETCPLLFLQLGHMVTPGEWPILQTARDTFVARREPPMSEYGHCALRGFTVWQEPKHFSTCLMGSLGRLRLRQEAAAVSFLTGRCKWFEDFTSLPDLSPWPTYLRQRGSTPSCSI